MAAWIQAHPEARVQFFERVMVLKPYTREAIMFGLVHNFLALSQGGRLQTGLAKSDAEKFMQRLDNEAKECNKRARFIGRWFASAGTIQTVMALWGIKP
jgi:hypothetical protein